MQLTPRYGADPVITLDGAPADIVGPLLRQRRRLVAALGSFTDHQWSSPSRCDGWSTRDVVVHLDSTNAFWTFSIAAGLQGEPTQFLTSFDPVASPAELVAGTDGVEPAEVIERFTGSTESLADLVSSLHEDDWSLPAEAPPGHLGIGAVAHHALWDSWIHERDILLPLGISPDEEADEVTACLRYVAALGPALALTRGDTDRGVLAIDATDPATSFVVEIGDRVAVRSGSASADLRLTGAAVELTEALSVRIPLDQSVPPGTAWMLGGLSETFDLGRP